jgi:small-conductance mechanosensitive channel
MFRVGSIEGMTASERARRIERRINALAERSRLGSPMAIEVVPAGAGSLAVAADGLTVVTVHESDADEQLTALHDLAGQWAAEVERALQRAQTDRPALVRFGREVAASIRAAFSRLGESALRVVPSLLAAGLVIVFFWAAARGVRLLMRIVFRRVVGDLTIENLIKQVGYYSVWIVGLLVAAGAIGFEPQAVITGLGLTSLALGFALKDILSNFVSGLLILVMRPFELGDQVVVGASEGAVEKIDLRATHIRTYDGRLALVPNAEVFTSRVINNTDAQRRRGSVRVHVGHPTDLPGLAERLTAAVTSVAGVETMPPVSTVVSSLEKDDAVLEVRFWTDSRRSDFVIAGSDVLRRVYEVMREEKIYPTNPSVRVLVPGRPEIWQEMLSAHARDGR